MHCPFCESDKDSLKVIDSRGCDGGRSIRRRRECLHCGKRFTTYERVEEHSRLTVVKKDGRRVPWDRNKILAGLERACFKRPVPERELARVVDEVEEETFKSHDREAPSSFVGQLVADKLRRLDQVAYVRFASVYRQFQTLEELVDAARAVIDAKRFEDPDQGRLFIEPTPAHGRDRGGIVRGTDNRGANTTANSDGQTPMNHLAGRAPRPARQTARRGSPMPRKIPAPAIADGVPSGTTHAGASHPGGTNIDASLDGVRRATATRDGSDNASGNGERHP